MKEISSKPPQAVDTFTKFIARKGIFEANRITRKTAAQRLYKDDYVALIERSEFKYKCQDSFRLVILIIPTPDEINPVQIIVICSVK